MNKRSILKVENGTLYLKIQETFEPETLEVSSVVAKITRDGVVIVSPDAISPLTLTHSAIEALADGVNFIEVYWEADTLSRKSVLLDCGCIVNWDEYQEDFADEDRNPPVEGDEAYCEEHDEVLIVRFNKIDFQEA
jgi:hypothetical protein